MPTRRPELVFVRAVLLLIDHKMTPRKADAMAANAKRRLQSISKDTGEYRLPVAEYTVIIGKGDALNGGT